MTKNSKFIREYGTTLEKIAEKYNATKWCIYALHLKGELHDFIKKENSHEKVESNTGSRR